jgi:hypothetical protein
MIGIRFPAGVGNFLLDTMPRSALGPTQPPIQWALCVLGVKRPGSEPGHSLQFSTEVKECVELYLHSPNTSSQRGARLSTGTPLTLPLNYCLIEYRVDTTAIFWLCMGWTMRVLGFDSRQGLEIFRFTTASRPALWPTQPPIQWVPGAISLGVKWPVREADRSPPSSAEDVE